MQIFMNAFENILQYNGGISDYVIVMLYFIGLPLLGSILVSAVKYLLKMLRKANH